ncbi:putative non-specific serine/threonine protein kinase [Helianthus annuus]|nr:putative non-specific serine/threonine protein kinase [Helianthus annuus]
MGPSLHDVIRTVHVGLLCVQENVISRPTMDSVVHMLHSFSVTLHVPSEPAFFYSSKKTSGLQDPKISESINEVSISDFIPR